MTTKPRECCRIHALLIDVDGVLVAGAFPCSVLGRAGRLGLYGNELLLTAETHMVTVQAT